MVQENALGKSFKQFNLSWAIAVVGVIATIIAADKDNSFLEIRFWT